MSAHPRTVIGVETELTQGPDGLWYEPRPPAECPSCGHPWGRGAYSIGWEACLCTPSGGHRTVRCGSCDEITAWRPDCTHAGRTFRRAAGVPHAQIP